MQLSRAETRTPTAGIAPRSLCLSGRRIPLILPSRRDLRLRLGAVITTLQVLGQTALGFKVSVAQILISVGCCALIEVVVSAWRQHALVWPASALLTGNSIAFILRAAGTRHGDWWSLNGIQYFLLASVVAMLSKHLIRLGGRHIYNPSNLGLVACLLLVGAGRAYPQYLWWGAVGVPLELALGVILAGLIVVVHPARMLLMALSFALPFDAAICVLAATGHCFAATWSYAPVCGGSYVGDVILSPEVLVFVLFMMSDPRTAPDVRWTRCLYGAGTALVAVALLTPQPTEYGIKVAILASLTVVCTAQSLARLVQERRARSSRSASTWSTGTRRSVTALARPSVLATVIIATLVIMAVGALADDPHILNLEETPALPGAPGGQ